MRNLFFLVLTSLLILTEAHGSQFIDRLFENQGYFSLYNCDVELVLSQTPENCLEGVDCRFHLMIYAKDRLRGNEIEFSHVFDPRDHRAVEKNDELLKEFKLDHNWILGELRGYQHFEMSLNDRLELSAIEIAEGVVPVKAFKRRVRCSSNPY
ncbi:hypothetical protein GW915_09715 [bacterium]|nr:hypothetical protein [bacterium]